MWERKRMPDGQHGTSIIKQLMDGGIGYLWFVLLALWGGTVSYIGRMKRDDKSFKALELLGELVISSFAGLITAYGATELGFSFTLTCALAGVAGHMGGKAIKLIETIVVTRLGMESGDRGKK